MYVIMGGKEVELEDNDEVKKGNDDKEEEKELWEDVKWCLKNNFTLYIHLILLVREDL